MSQNYDNPAFKKLLKKLQEESWQLELIISGFAIFGQDGPPVIAVQSPRYCLGLLDCQPGVDMLQS